MHAIATAGNKSADFEFYPWAAAATGKLDTPALCFLHDRIVTGLTAGIVRLCEDWEDEVEVLDFRDSTAKAVALLLKRNFQEEELPRRNREKKRRLIRCLAMVEDENDIDTIPLG